MTLFLGSVLKKSKLFVEVNFKTFTISNIWNLMVNFVLSILELFCKFCPKYLFSILMLPETWSQWLFLLSSEFSSKCTATLFTFNHQRELIVPTHEQWPCFETVESFYCSRNIYIYLSTNIILTSILNNLKKSCGTNAFRNILRYFKIVKKSMEKTVQL